MLLSILKNGSNVSEELSNHIKKHNYVYVFKTRFNLSIFSFFKKLSKVKTIIKNNYLPPSNHSVIFAFFFTITNFPENTTKRLFVTMILPNF